MRQVLTAPPVDNALSFIAPAISPPLSLLNNRLPLKDARKRQGGQQRDRASVSPPFPASFFPALSKEDARLACSTTSGEKKEERERGKNS